MINESTFILLWGNLIVFVTREMLMLLLANPRNAKAKNLFKQSQRALFSSQVNISIHFTSKIIRSVLWRMFLAVNVFELGQALSRRRCAYQQALLLAARATHRTPPALGAATNIPHTPQWIQLRLLGLYEELKLLSIGGELHYMLSQNWVLWSTS